jgi:hypothetical protein
VKTALARLTVLAAAALLLPGSAGAQGTIEDYRRSADPSSTMQLVNALINAGKDFELLITPNGGHGAMGPDGNRRRNDFFIRSLYGITPPDWNGGATVQAQATSASEAPAPEPASDSPDAEGAPAYGFFESPADSHGE